MSEVIVMPEQRGSGIGKLLVRHLVVHAVERSIEELLLYTVEQEISYARTEWRRIGQDYANGEAIVIMCLPLRENISE